MDLSVQYLKKILLLTILKLPIYLAYYIYILLIIWHYVRRGIAVAWLMIHFVLDYKNGKWYNWAKNIASFLCTYLLPLYIWGARRKKHGIPLSLATGAPAGLRSFFALRFSGPKSDRRPEGKK